MPTPGDQGGGTFVNSGTALCTGFYTGGDDGGVVIQATGTGLSQACYYRQFTGAVHLKWYGVTNNQYIDTGCYGSTNCLANAFKAAQQFGYGILSHPVGVVDTDGLRIRSNGPVAILGSERLTCSAPFTGLMVNSDYSTVGGAIVLDHGATIQILPNLGLSPPANADQVEFDHCLVLTDGHNGAAITLNPTTHDIAVANNTAMVTNGDTGIFCDGAEQPYIHEVTVIGFDNGVTSFNCGRFRLEHANIDADVPVYIADGQNVANLSHIRAQPFLSRGISGRNLSYSVSSVGPGSGSPPVCRVTLPGAPDIATGDYVYLNGDGNYHSSEGVLGCEGLHVATKVDSTHFDLQGTSCPGSDCYGSPTAFLTTGATWALHSQVIHVSDTTGIHANETVSSSDSGVFTGTVKVISVSPYSKTVVVDQFTKDASSGSQTMSFTNTGSCPSGSACGLTLYDFATVHIAAGNSVAGLATNHKAACIRAGGPGDTSALGVIADDIFCSQFQIEYDLESADPFTCTGCGFDNEPDLADSTQIAILYGRATPPLPLTGHVNTGVLNKITNLKVTGISPDLFITAQHAGWYQTYAVTSADHLTSYGTVTGISADGNTLTVTPGFSSPGDYSIVVYPLPSQEDTGAADFVGTDFGSGGGVIVDSANGYCNAMQGGIVKPNGTDILAVEFVHGCANINLSTNKANDVLVGAGAGAGSTMIGSNLPSGAMVLEPNPTTPLKFGALGNYFGSGGPANTANLGANASCPSSSDITVLVLCGGGAQNNADSGNAYSQCNPNYTTGCVQHGMTAAGAARQLDSSGNPVEEFRDSAHMQLTHTYQDAIAASPALSAPTLSAGVNVVASCSGTGCSVKLPLSDILLDVSTTPVGSSCASVAAGKCGAAGGVTVINNTSGAITVLANTGESVNGTTSDTVSARRSKTYWPFSGSPLSGGWISN